MSFQEQLNILITADASGAIQVFRGFGSTATSEMQKVEGAAARSGTAAGGAFGQGFASDALKGLEAVVAGFGAIKLVNFAKDSISDAVEFQRANASLSAAVAGVGSASGVTKEGIDKLSESIQKQDAIWQGDVKGAATLLLTMENIKNEAGAGNNIFDRTLKLTAAIANVGHKDISTVATQLGRALDNPEAGLQAFSRSGIPLSAEIKAQVTELAKRGDLLGAQKALIENLEPRFLDIGAAAAKADPLQQFNVELTKFKTVVGEDLLPAAGLILGSLATIAKAFEDMPQPIRVATEALVAFTVARVAFAKVSPVLAAIGGLGKTESTVVSTGATGAATGAAEANSGASSQAAAGAEAYTAALEAQTEATVAATAAAERLAAALTGTAGAEAAAGEALGDDLVVITSFTAETEVATKTIADLGVTITATAASAQAGFLSMRETVASIGPAAAGSLGFVNARGAALGGVPASGPGTISGENVAGGVISGQGAALVGESVLANGTAVKAASTEELLAARTALLEKEAGAAAFSFAGLGSKIAGVAAPIAGAVIGVYAIATAIDYFAKKSTDVDTLAQSMRNLAKDGTDGAAKFQSSVNKIDFDALKQGNVANTGTFGLPIVHPAVQVGQQITGLLGIGKTETEIKAATDEVNARFEAMNQLLASGDINAANAGFQELSKEAIAAGVALPQDKVDAFLRSLQEFNDKAKDIPDVFKIIASFAGQFEKLQTGFTLTSQYDAVQKAVKQVDEDYGDLIGTSKKAQAADQQEQDAKHGVADATRGVTDAKHALRDAYEAVTDSQRAYTDSLQKEKDAVHSLKEAEQDLALFNSARGQRERALAHDILVRRYVTTPEGEDQKQLDLLKEQDDTSKKAQELADRVHSAQEGVAAATRAVEKAYRGERDALENVGKAKQGVEDATYREKRAEDQLTQATKNRKQVAIDAAARIKEDHDKEQQALLTLGTTLQDLVAQHKLLPEAAEHWTAKLGDAANQMKGPVSDAVDDLASKVRALNTAAGSNIQTPTAQNAGQKVPGTGVTYGGYEAFYNARPANERNETFAQWAHKRGVPGYAEGALVAATGGIDQADQHVAEIAKAGTTPRMWAEKETGGEAYIPLAQSKRERSTAILQQTAAMFGLIVADKNAQADTKRQSYVDGGIASLEMYANGGTTTNNAYAFANGGTTLPNVPQLTVVHRDERDQEQKPVAPVTVNQENHFHGKDTPSTADLEYANRALGWQLTRTGRS